MEDLIPLLIFIVIAVINLLRYQAEKKGKGKPPAPEQESPRHQPATLEEFFEEIARKFEPKPPPQPEWPENVERPDYMKEMEEVERAQAEAFEEEEPAMAITVPAKKPAAPVLPRGAPKSETAELRATSSLGALRLPAQGAVFAGLGGMRIKTTPLLRSAAGKTDFDLKGRQSLKQAIIASLVLGPPRAYETSFDNTIAK